MMGLGVEHAICIWDCIKLNARGKHIEDEKCPKTRAKGELSETCWKVGKR